MFFIHYNIPYGGENLRRKNWSDGMISYLKCMLMVAGATGLPPHILPVIQSLEGGAPGMVRLDNNGTADLGVMQVNTIWIPAFAARSGLSETDTKDRLIKDPCFNITAAALILQTYLAQTDGDLLRAVGDYHSHTPSLNSGYTALAIRRADEMFGNSN